MSLLIEHRIRSRLWLWSITTVLAIFGWLSVGPTPGLIPVLYLAVVSPVLAHTDIVERRLPNRWVLPGYLASSLAFVMAVLVDADSAATPLASGVVYFTLMLVMALAGGVGFGDVKLAGVLGSTAGFLGAATVLVSALSAFVLGGIAAVVVLVSRREGADRSIPFGPFLLAGFWVAVVLRLD